MLSFVSDEPLKALFRSNAALSRQYEALKASRDEDDPELAVARKKFDENQQQLEQADQRYQAALEQHLQDLKAKAAELQDRIDLARRPAMSLAARREQKRLLEQQIKLAELDVQEAKALGDLGKATLGEVRAKEREVLNLRLQLAGLDAPTEDPAGATLITDDEEKEIRRIQAMIRNSPDLVNARAQGVNGYLTPLCSAASAGWTRVAKFLLDNGADINLDSPLRSAAARGHKAMVELLLRRGADVNVADSQSKTALHLAAEQGFLSVTETLLAAKADPNLREVESQTPLTLAANKGSQPVVAALLAHGADPNVVSTVRPGYGANPVTEGRRMFGAPLHFAAAAGDVGMTALLLTNRADVSVRSIYDETPLAVAATLGKARIVELLLAAGADLNARASDQSASPLWLAVGGGHRDVVKLLLDHGANPDASAQSGQPGVTPLMLAAGRKDKDSPALLLKYKADPNLADARGNTALLNAVFNKSPDLVRILLAAGANPDTKNSSGIPALTISVTDAQSKEVATALLAAKADVNAPDRNGKTPLHYAAPYQPKDMVELLINAGADVNRRDNSGKTALDLVKEAKQPNSTVIAELLRQHGALDDLPNLDRIEVRRSSANYSAPAFQVDTNGWNEFGLLELIALQYGLISTERNAV